MNECSVQQTFSVHCLEKLKNCHVNEDILADGQIDTTENIRPSMTS